MKRNIGKKIFIILFLLALGSGLFLLEKKYNLFSLKVGRQAALDSATPQNSPLLSITPTKAPTVSARPSPSPTLRPTLTPSALPASITFPVPFFAQAPFGEWDDPIFQDGCEEAAVIMAMSWVNGASPTKEQAKQQIMDLSAFENITYGYAPDRSAADTANLFKDYFNHTNIEVITGIGAKEIKEALFAGNLVIAPINGRILKNPFYTPPGPEHHMIVIIGYDGGKNEFIVNDIGTRHGEKYRYASQRLEASLQDYPTGDHLPSVPGSKAMIVVSLRQG